MKKIAVFAILAGLALLIAASLALPAAAAPASKPFLGAWEGIDPDLSHVTMSIGGGAKDVYQITYKDDGASVCGKDADGQPIYAFMAKGTGLATGYHMDIDYPAAYCLKSPKELWGSFGGPLDYDPATDTMWDGYVLWTRK